MPTILRTSFEVINAKNFLSNFDAVPSIDNRLYIGLSRTTPWGDESIPPIPQDSVDEVDNFWNELIGLQIIDTSDIRFVVPRNNWTSGQEYYTFDNTSSSAFDQDFYVINSNLEVYSCVVKPGGSTVSTIEPFGHNNGSNIITGDGYEWKFLYRVSVPDSNELMNDSWMVVNWDTSDLISDQYLYGDVDAYKTLGAKYLIIRSDILSTGLPVDITYRQIAIIMNPLDSGGVNKLSATIALPASLTVGSGELLFLENKTPIIRTSGQSETVKIVLEF